MIRTTPQMTLIFLLAILRLSHTEGEFPSEPNVETILELPVNHTSKSTQQTHLENITEVTSLSKTPEIIGKSSFSPNTSISSVSSTVLHAVHGNETVLESSGVPDKQILDAETLEQDLLNPDGKDLREQEVEEVPRRGSSPNREEGNCNLPATDFNCKTELPKYYFDPRKESCLYLFYSDCDHEVASFSTGKECFLHCYKQGSNESQTYLIIREGKDAFQTSEDEMWTFRGNSRLSLDVYNDVSSDVFDVVFDLRTYSTRANILSVIEKEDSGSGSFHSFNIKLKNGKFGVEILCENWKENFFMDIGGIQEGAWHMYYVLVDQGKGEILLQLNSMRQTFFSPNLVKGNENFCSFFNQNENTRIWIGGDYDGKGVFVGDENSNLQNGLVGCLTNVSLFHSSKYLSLTSPLVMEEKSIANITRSHQCANRFPDFHQNNCSVKSACDERISDLDCGTTDQTSSLILSLHGNDYLSYRLYNWNERLHTFSNKFSFSFKTAQNDAILFHATGENLDSTKDFQFLSVSLTDSNQVLFSLNLGGETVSLKMGNYLTDNEWHEVFIVHERDRVRFTIDGQSQIKNIVTDNENYFFYLDPLVFIGGVPNLNKDCALFPRNGTNNEQECQESSRYFYNVEKGGCQNFIFSGCGESRNNFNDVTSCLEECHVKGLHSYNIFSGCLKDLAINGINILEDLAEKNGKAQYYGVMKEVPIGCECTLEEQPSISFTTRNSYIKLFRSSEESSFSLNISFRSDQNEAILAVGSITFLDSVSDWELRFSEKEVSFIVPVNFMDLKLEVNRKEIWREISLTSEGNEVRLSVKDGNFTTLTLEEDLAFRSEINVGSSEKKEIEGFIGCIDKIILDEYRLDLRSLIGSSMASNDVIMDGCQVLNPCERSSSCGAGVACTLVDDAPVCDCEGSEFEGPNCHIIKYRKSCEEYRTLGYNKSGAFVIDIDGTGPMPLTHVFCHFEDNGETFTVVTHNIPERFSNVKITAQSFMINVTYRDFSDEMLRYLISDSEACSQEIKFSCGDKITYFKEAWYSSAWQSHIDYLGEDPFGVCHCKGYEDCYSENENKDYDTKNVINRLNGYIVKNKTSLPVTSITFYREANESVPYSEPNLSIGELICQNKVRQDKTVRFSSSESSLILSPWIHGDLRFKFRTTTTEGNLLFQLSMNVNNPSFNILLTSENSIDFVYTIKREKRIVTFDTAYSLNNGQWNLIWIDTFSCYFRITLNDQIQIMELPSGNDIRMFDGVLILGHISGEYRLTEEPEMNDGFTGCIRGFISNDEEVNLVRAVSSPEGVGVFIGCAAACEEKPCRNEGTCVELWSSYECICENPFAHLGRNCENDININAITFTSEDSEAAYFNSHFITEEANPLKSNFTFNIQTSQSDAILFVAKDYIQNIIEVYLRGSSSIVTLFNYGKEIIELSVNTEDISLSEGQSVQIVIQRFDEETSLRVLSRGRTFSSTVGKGISLLTEEEYEQFPYEMFIGGVKSYGMTSDLPGFIGCFRGLSIDGKVLDFHESRNWNFGEGTEMGCTSKCGKDKISCQNGGYCINSFNEEEKYSCSCKGTSFVGELCDEETAYIFNGRVDGMALSKWTLNFSEFFEISFAFASDSLTEHDQILVFVHLTNENTSETGVFVAILDMENSVQIKLWLSNFEYVANQRLHSENFVRHFIEANYRNDLLEVTIDKNSVEISSHTLTEPNSEYELQNQTLGLIIGGMRESTNKENSFLTDLTNFEGCISNLNMKSSDMDIWPLEDYNNGKEFLRYGLPKSGSCSVFSSVRAGPVFYDFSETLDWKYPEPEIMALNIFSEENVSLIDVEMFTTEINATITSPPLPLTSQIWPWALLSSCIFLIILIVILCLIKRRLKTSAVSNKNETDAEFGKTLSQPKVKEEIPLLDKEPGMHPKSAQSTVPVYGLAPDNSFKSKIQGKKEAAVPLQGADEKDTPEHIPDQESKPKAVPLNSMNRESNTKIPFKNQLSLDSNSLRHIDSSSEDSIRLDTPQNTPEEVQHFQDAITTTAVDQIASFPDEAKMYNNVNDVTDSGPDSADRVNRNDKDLAEEIDMKKYYLIRKASEPPTLPPKRK